MRHHQAKPSYFCMRILYARIFKTLIVKTLTLMKDIDGKHCWAKHCWVVAATPLHVLVTSNNCPYCHLTISLPVRIQLLHSSKRSSQNQHYFSRLKAAYGLHYFKPTHDFTFSTVLLETKTNKKKGFRQFPTMICL